VFGAIAWAKARPDLRVVPLGLFGASTGAAAALIAAGRAPAIVRAVVSRGGRPDLADRALPMVQAPTLLIVGGDDEPVIGMNREAMERMRAPVELQIIGGATHLFEEPGALEKVAELATEWFNRHLRGGTP
jgi:dienelactone hydrolase